MDSAYSFKPGASFRALNMAGVQALDVVTDGAAVLVNRHDRLLARLRLDRKDNSTSECALRLDHVPDADAHTQVVIAAALEAIQAVYPQFARFELCGGNWSALAPALLAEGLAIELDGSLWIFPELFWQLPQLWLPNANTHSPFPQALTLSNGRFHPRRPPKPVGEVYSRRIPWLDQTLSFRALDIDADLERFNRWMNDPRVAAFWNEDGDFDKHRHYLSNIAADPHMLMLIGCADGVPFSYFEIYWAKENRLGPFYDAGDYDRGWHVVVGEDAYRGRAWISAWLPSLVHYLFLDDCRTQRIVGEPASNHHQQIRNLEASGFASVKNFDFPHKRARLVTLLRERFFADRLWLPSRATA